MFLLSAVSLKRPLVFVLLGLATLTGVVLVSPCFYPRKAPFNSLSHFEHWARQHGFFVHSGKGDPKITENNFFVADHPLDIDQIGRLCLSRCGETESWKGIVWVTQRKGQELNEIKVWGHFRIWGPLLVAGDPALLDRMEELVCRQD
jgi:hypothetical protein